MRVFFFAPDRHIEYEGSTAERKGVGGGITVRLRMAAALARLGHDVTVGCNCKQSHHYRGVRYLPLDSFTSIQTDVLVVHITGENVNVGSVLEMSIAAGIRVLLVDGVAQPQASVSLPLDWTYACSNFIAGVIRSQWNLHEADMFVTHHGINRPSLWTRLLTRDPFRLIYSSHPSKGLHAAMALTKRLRAEDKRFVLHCYGGEELWGGQRSDPRDEEGVHHHGMVGQDTLVESYARSGFALHLQQREEPFGIALCEAMGAGCIVVASPVGAFPELVSNRQTGLLVAGEPEAETTRDQAAEAILKLVRDKKERTTISNRAAQYPLSWDSVAKTWDEHWHWLLAGRATKELRACSFCGGGALRLADGNHCTGCGLYER